jgi:hypothetical protein
MQFFEFAVGLNGELHPTDRCAMLHLSALRTKYASNGGCVVPSGCGGGGYRCGAQASADSGHCQCVLRAAGAEGGCVRLSGLLLQPPSPSPGAAGLSVSVRVWLRFAGAKAIYLSGSGVATASHGLPDLGITNLNDVAEDVRRITG